MSLKDELIRLGEVDPSLREDIYPVIDHLERDSASISDHFQSRNDLINPSNDVYDYYGYDSVDDEMVDEEEVEDEILDSYQNGDYGDQAKNESFYPDDRKQSSVKLADKLVELGYDYPELRDDLRPVLSHLKTSADDQYWVKVKHHNYKGGPSPAEIGLTAPPTNTDVVFEGEARSITAVVGLRGVTKHWRDWVGPGGYGASRRNFTISTKENKRFSGGAYYSMEIGRTDGQKLSRDEIIELRDIFS